MFFFNKCVTSGLGAANKISCKYQTLQDRSWMEGEPHVLTKHLVLDYKRFFLSQNCIILGTCYLTKSSLTQRSVGEEMREGRGELLLYITQFSSSFLACNGQESNSCGSEALWELNGSAKRVGRED